MVKRVLYRVLLTACSAWASTAQKWPPLRLSQRQWVRVTAAAKFTPIDQTRTISTSASRLTVLSSAIARAACWTSKGRPVIVHTLRAMWTLPWPASAPLVLTLTGQLAPFQKRCCRLGRRHISFGAAVCRHSVAHRSLRFYLTSVSWFPAL